MPNQSQHPLSTYFEKLEEQADPKGRRWEIRKELDALNYSAKPISAKMKQKLLQEEAAILKKIRDNYALAPTEARERKALERAKLIYPIVQKCKSEGHTSYRQLAACLSKSPVQTPSGKDEWNVGNVQSLMVQIKKIEASQKS